MSKSLKQKNKPQIATFLVVNTCVLFALMFGPSRVIRFLSEATKGDLSSLGKVVAAPAFLSLLVGIIGWALPRSWKEVLVFWRAGTSRLPSSQAFSDLAARDPRINLDRLRNRVGKFPKKPAKQTALWYGVYQKHSAEPQVEDANAAYLRYRDMSALLPLLVAASVILAVLRRISWPTGILITGVFFAEFIIVTQAARNAAKSLVTNVLAIESSAEMGEGQERLQPGS